MSIERKIARRMAKTQMKKDGIQHPCHQYKPGVSVSSFVPPASGKTSYFASHWRKAAAKRQAELMGTPKTKQRRRVRTARAGA